MNEQNLNIFFFSTEANTNKKPLKNAFFAVVVACNVTN